MSELPIRQPVPDSDGFTKDTAHIPLILVVDDEPSNILALYEALKAEHEVCMATTGEQALTFCSNRTPDLILLDIGLPDLDGRQVYRRLKGNERTWDVPVIFVTADTDILEEANALANGAADFITKPFHEIIVKARVKTQLTLLAQHKKLQSLAITDDLTKLANRRRFDEVLEVEWRRAMRDHKPLSLLMIDVDHFKLFNDLYGHQAGDRCLWKLSDALLRGYPRRPGDLVARYGGEELVILLSGADEAFAIATAETVRSAIESLAIPHTSKGHSGGVVTASIGVATHRPYRELTHPQDLIRDADAKLYQAKSAGRNKVIA